MIPGKPGVYLTTMLSRILVRLIGILSLLSAPNDNRGGRYRHHARRLLAMEKSARGSVSRVLSSTSLLRQAQDFGRCATIPLGDGLLRRSSNQPGRLAGGCHAPPLFGLAPGGVYPAAAVTSGAVRSYRTVSTWPHRNAVVCFLWHFPWGHPRRTLTGTVPRWSPDFPPLCGYPHNGGRPTLWPERPRATERVDQDFPRAARPALTDIFGR